MTDGNIKRGAKGAATTSKRKKRRAKKKKTASSKKGNVKRKEAKIAKETGSNRLSMLGSASLEPTLSFSLFGNRYDLDEFCEQPAEKMQGEEQVEKK